MKDWNGRKTVFVFWLLLGLASLFCGVTRVTFACIWLLYLFELAGHAKRETADQTEAILKDLRVAAADALADVGIDDTEAEASYDTGRHDGINEAAAIIKEHVNYGKDKS